MARDRRGAFFPSLPPSADSADPSWGRGVGVGGERRGRGGDNEDEKREVAELPPRPEQPRPVASRPVPGARRVESAARNPPPCALPGWLAGGKMASVWDESEVSGPGGAVAGAGVRRGVSDRG